MSHPTAIVQAMSENTRRSGFKRGALQFIAAGLVALAAIGLSLSSAWVFRSRPATTPDESVWRLLLSDRTTVGFVRLALIGIALYALVSIAALVVGGRWIRVFGAGGFEADAVATSEEIIADLRDRLARDQEILKVVSLSEEEPGG